ncbi:MAG: ATP-binding protein [Actinomadura sp.]
MADGTHGDDTAKPGDGTRSELSGFAGDVVQARDVRGGVHFHREAASEFGAIPRQLPAGVRGFVDRSQDLARLDLILAGDEADATASALCVIAGTAGVGKTSLVVHWAHRVQGEFPDGQLYVNLHGYDPGSPVTSGEALDRFLRALDVPSSAIPTDVEARAALFRSRLAGRRVLIVLDNASSVGQVRPLLPGTQGCLVLVTSRSRLSGLVARDGAHRLTLAMLPEPDAVALIRRVVSDYRAADDMAELTELSRLCARLPLALRIAAERAAGRPTMPLRELISDLRDESALWDALTAGDDDESDAIRTVFAWSYRALTSEVSQLFRLLGLHPGPDFSARAAAALADAPLGKARRLLDDLVGVHLLEQPTSNRYQFHDLLRAYAIDQVRQHKDATVSGTALRRLLLWYLRMADAALTAIVPAARQVPLARSDNEQERFVFSDYDEAIRWYEEERVNLVAAVRAADEAAMHDITWQLPATLHRIYANRNQFDDWSVTSTIALGAVRHVGDRAGEAEILESLGKMYTQSRQLDQGIGYHQAALSIRREIGDRLGETSSVNGVGLAMLRDHRLAEAKSHFEETYTLASALGDRAWEAIAVNNLANVFFELGQLDEAQEYIQHALAQYRELGDRGAEGDALRCASQIQRKLGNLVEATQAIEAALDIARELDNRTWEAWWLVELGRVQMANDQPDDALESFHQAATLQRRIGDQSREADAWDATGEVYRALGRYEEAIDFHRRAVFSCRQLGQRWHLAIALDNLATALAETGATTEANTHWADAKTILSDFTDPAADRLRDRVSRLPQDTRQQPDP